MTRDVACPNCLRMLRMPENLDERELQCPVCATVFTEPECRVPPPARGTETDAAPELYPPPACDDALGFGAEAAAVAAPSYRLSPTRHVFLATFFAGPLAGCFVLALNCISLGRRRTALLVVAAGAGCVAAVVLSPFEMGASLLMGLGLLVALTGIAHWAFGARYAEHCRRGGKTRSGWVVFGCMVLSWVLVLGGALLLESATGPAELPKIMIGTQNEVYFAAGVEEREVRRLGEYLRREGYFQEDRPASVKLSRSGAVYEVAFVLQTGAWNKPDVVTYFEDLGAGLRRDVFPNKNVLIQLCDDTWAVRRSCKINP